VGDLNIFEKEFEYDLLVIDYAVREFRLPEGLKLSVHSGSDKFSLYPLISKHIKKYNKGLHIKTAGTTWLEELAGLSLSGGDGLRLGKVIYSKAYSRYDELCAPYATVIDIDRSKLPDPEVVDQWDGRIFSESLRHDPSNKIFNPNFRQILHVGYKIAAEFGQEFINLVKKNEKIINPLVTENLFEKHIKPIFID
jgi:hypothetical protein